MRTPSLFVWKRPPRPQTCQCITNTDMSVRKIASGICNEMLAMISYHAGNLIVGIPFIALKTCWESCFFEASVNNPSIPTQKLRWYQLTRIASKIRSRLQSRQTAGRALPSQRRISCRISASQGPFNISLVTTIMHQAGKATNKKRYLHATDLLQYCYLRSSFG